MTTYEKIVKGATKIKVAAPKPKYIEPILLATSHHEDFRTVMRYLQLRLHDSAWSIVYKALIVLHIMIREGERDITLSYLSRNPEMLNVGHIASVNSDTRSLLRYAKYLHARAMGFEITELDYVRDERVNNSSLSSSYKNRDTATSGGRLRTLSINKGLLLEVESVEKQIESLLKCKFQEVEVNNDIILTAFRLLVNDLLALYQSLNEGVINILEHYFEMDKPDATLSLKIYKKFVKLTVDVVNYLRTAKHLEYTTKLHVPTIRHAPTALADSLEEYLNDADFEANRKQYLAEKGAKTGKDDVLTRSKSRSASGNTVRKSSASNNGNKNPTNSNDKPTNNNSAKNADNLVVQSTGYNPFAQLVQKQQAQSQLPAQSQATVPQAQPQPVVSQPQSVQPQQIQPQATVIHPIIFPQQTQFALQQPLQQPPQQQQQFIAPLTTGQQIFGANGQFVNGQIQQAQQQQQPQLTNFVQSQNGLVQHNTHNPFAGAQQPLQQQQPQQFQQQQGQPQIQQQNSHIQPLSTGFGFGNFTGAGSANGTGAGGFQGRNSVIDTAGLSNGTTGTSNSITSNSSVNNTGGAAALGRSKSVNPFSLGNYTTGTALSSAKNNPFTSANVSKGSTNNPFSTSNVSTTTTTNGNGSGSIVSQTTGVNPFAQNNSQLQQQQQRPLKPQPTFGGLENLATVPVFPETQQLFTQQQSLQNAQAQLNQAKNQLWQQQTGQFQQQQQQQFAQQTGQFPQQQQQQPYYNPNVASLI